MRRLLPASSFERAAKRLAAKRPECMESIRNALVLLESDAFDPRLHTHKLKGALAESWSCSAGYDLRIVFRFVSDRGSEAIALLSVGTHDGVY